MKRFGQPLARPVEIWATDLSEPALRKARTGFYRGRALQNLPGDLLARYFTPKADGYLAGDALRALVRFESLNLLEPFPRYASSVDIIFCQNVTIYFQLKTCQELIGRFYGCLPAGGLLCLGFSETLWNIFDRFHSREVAGAYVYYKETLELSAPPAATPSRHARSNAKIGTAPRSALGPARPDASTTGVSRDHKALLDHADVASGRGQSDQVALASGRGTVARAGQNR